ncbi:MAG: hypothetical protein Q4A04_05155 [Eubacteriales bacterium]|nr:hypothetical protein [Eubacteriales bacterium]
MFTNKGECCTKQLMVHMITGELDKECTLKQDLEKSSEKYRKVFKGLVMSEEDDKIIPNGQEYRFIMVRNIWKE